MSSAINFIMTMLLFTGFSVNAYPAAQDWPKECKGRSYCHIKPSYYPTETFNKLLDGVKFEFEQSGGISNRSSENDVADCPRSKMYEKFYLIMDKSDTIRFVAQNENTFTIMLEIEECREPGPTNSPALDEDKLHQQRVDCYESKIPFKFPVLSLDGSKLETEAPKGGLPMSCSAKVIAKT